MLTEEGKPSCVYTYLLRLFLSKDRIDGISIQARQFQEAGHFDADNIRKKQEALVVRYDALREPMAMRKQKLSDSLRLQQLFRDVEDEETWIREKEPIAASTNRGETPLLAAPGVRSSRRRLSPSLLALLLLPVCDSFTGVCL